MIKGECSIEQPKNVEPPQGVDEYWVYTLPSWASEAVKVALFLLLLSGCAKSVSAPDPVFRRYLACTAGMGDEFFEAFPKRYRHEAHRITAKCLESY